MGLMSILHICVADNSSNDDTLFKALGIDLIFSNDLYDASQRRLQCVGHVVNLIVLTFMVCRS